MYLQYVTRWQMGDTLYYAAMQNTAANQPAFYAGQTQSVDLCSVSACFPHVLTYPEPGLGGSQESGSFSSVTDGSTACCKNLPSPKCAARKTSPSPGGSVKRLRS